ncbi:hypothetical protein GP486_001620 [Trichoglossum hirsutum]|uniref:Uncharacterized protein n=1 Tax=Trichoglossum hirsutum TaxID=265104 RepID=A0A9P8RSG3_9PEZI|nr:hypothetical protein GP486_001620 [Trichoglossum hirsutum]
MADAENLSQRLMDHPIPDGEATGEDINVFLNLLQEVSDQHKEGSGANRRIVVVDNEVAYRDAVHRHNYLALTCNAELEEENEEDEKEEKENSPIKAWREMLRLWGTAEDAVRQCNKAAECNLLLVATHPNLVWENSFEYRYGRPEDLDEARTRHYQRLADWHAYAIKIQNRMVWIYDPSYVPPEGSGSRVRRLGELPWLKRASQIIKAYRNRSLVVQRINLGGGGNDDRRCQDMACEWIRSEVLRYMGRLDEDGGTIIVNNWEQVRM